MSFIQDETTVLSFNRSKFVRDFVHIRKFVKKRTQYEAASEIGISRNVIAGIEAFVKPQGRYTILLAFWADMDLREYVEVKLRKEIQPELNLDPLPSTTLPDTSK